MGQSNDYEREMADAEGMAMNSPGGYGNHHHQQHNNHVQGRGATSSGPFVPQAAVPTQNGKLSSFAGEFWFPECRNCPCCKGFKHGCDCCKSGGVTTCKDPNCIDGAFETQVNAELASRPVPATSSASAPPSSGPAHGGAKNSYPPASTGGDNLCKFEKSPGGCRFGASCRFQHANPNSGAAQYSAQQGGAGPTKCSFFARGNCQFGDACRFAHY